MNAAQRKKERRLEQRVLREIFVPMLDELAEVLEQHKERPEECAAQIRKEVARLRAASGEGKAS